MKEGLPTQHSSSPPTSEGPVVLLSYPARLVADDLSAELKEPRQSYRVATEVLQGTSGKLVKTQEAWASP